MHLGHCIPAVLALITTIQADGNQTCFWKLSRRSLQGIEPVHIERLTHNDECRYVCLAMGDYCQSYTFNIVTGFCKLYNMTKTADGATLRKSEKDGYYERNTYCSESDIKKIMDRSRQKRQLNAKPPGPPGSSEDPAGFPVINTQPFEAGSDTALPEDTINLWLEWTSWSPCSKTCNVGIQHRQFVCANPRCVKKANQTRTCRIQGCPTRSRRQARPQWDDWAPWSSCSVSCGSGGQKLRTRGCQGYGCAGKNKEQLDCGKACPEWQPWSPWGQCSKTCGGGSQKRQRLCSGYGGCQGTSAQDQPCSNQPCCTNWTPWSQCSVTCGEGTAKRTRRCTAGKLQYASKTEDETQACTGEQPECCTWSEWSPWEPCDKTCDGGYKKRTRIPSTYDGGCEGDADQTARCNEEQCPSYEPWAKWTLCTVSCGGGTKSRTRVCRPSDGACDGAADEEDDCNENPCPEWSDWGPWGECSASCAGGFQKRGRTCNQYNLCPGDKKERRECNTHVCPQYGPWGKWEVCTEPCGGGQRLRDRECVVDTGYCTADKLGSDQTCKCDGPPNDAGVCNDHKCAEWGPWEAWGSCSSDCGGGTQTRTRVCENDSSFCSTHATDPSCQCEGDDEEETSCGDRGCAEWSEWKEWGECSASCGGGDRERKRTCINDEEYCTGANAQKEACTCPGLDHSNEQCNAHVCPSWQPWGSWGECSQNCGGGERTRTRICKTDAAYCADKQTDDSCVCVPTDINGEFIDAEISEPCNDQTCAEWSQWGEWAECSVTCGEGNKERKRTCQADPSFCASNPDDEACICEGEDTDGMECNLGDCPEWGPWSEWGECSVSCSFGTETRTRECSRDDAPCEGDDKGDTDTRECDKGVCPQWTPWTTWTECTVLCGGGSRTRARTCPILDGCAGLNEDSGICGNIPCPDWGNWAPWSDCSASCGGGERSRTRTCPIEGACKPGNPFEIDPVPCNTHACPIWAQWGEWSQCSLTCGDGQRVRKRSCTPPDGCLGRNEDFEECRESICLITAFWSAWSPCTKTCAGGTQFRSRAECPEGPPKCGIERESQDCEPQACPEWTEWGDWTDCNRPCGKGQRSRKRTCPIVNGCVGQAKEIDPLPCNDIPCFDAPQG